YGQNSSYLASTTTNVDVVLNTTRASEANVTIIESLNNSVVNKLINFNVTANITMLGNDGIGCNATVSFSDDQTINVTSGENLTHALGNIPFGNSKVTNWSLTGLHEGSSNITVRAYCELDGIKLDKLDFYILRNITIRNLAPVITRIAIVSPIDLAAGDNLSVECNATVNENNTVADIRNLNATLYQSSIGHYAPDDNNNHYTNTSCTNVSSNTFEANYSCGFKVAYYANNGEWQCNVSAVDFSNVTAFFNISTSINELMAIDVSPAIIDYGNLKATNVSGDFNVTIRNVGNMPINTTVRGFAPSEGLAYLNLSMVCESSNISNANQRFSAVNGTDFTQMTKLNNDTQTINLTLPQRTNDLSFGNDSNLTFWKLQVPPLRAGICNGTLLFGAIPMV
ncbi:MAG: hypothetical protein AABX32_03445, partial [Nanoarchaeota archaeon]